MLYQEFVISGVVVCGFVLLALSACSPKGGCRLSLALYAAATLCSLGILLSDCCLSTVVSQRIPPNSCLDVVVSS